MRAAKKKSVRLPDKASDLLELAVRDAMRCEAQPDKYRLEMRTWYRTNGVCAVCMAGAVMAETLGYDARVQIISFDDFAREVPKVIGNDNADALEKVNCMREGEWYPGCTTPAKPALDLIRTHFDRESQRAPWDVYLKAAAMLREAGL